MTWTGIPISIFVLLHILFADPVQSSPIHGPNDSDLVSRDAVPDCQDWSSPYKGGYADGSGTYGLSNGVTHPYVFPAIRKCWYDFFVVKADTYFLPWERNSGKVYCTKSERCSISKTLGKSHCKTQSISVAGNVGITLLGQTLGVTVTITNDDQKCNSADDATSCSWNDGGCHVIWSQQEIFRQTGYRRKRCNYGHGDQTMCMENWEQNTPTTRVNYGCGSKCSD
ncbi:hypothetical protein BGZ63DRAFT_408319 [Mariannaea sp. PMI_226]|nr:hypothetical protein BGZ63DRAFT_408319 [Mariannaea sp. PMI_226]